MGEQDPSVDEELAFAEAMLSFLGKHEAELRERGVDVDVIANGLRQIVERRHEAAKVRFFTPPSVSGMPRDWTPREPEASPSPDLRKKAPRARGRPAHRRRQ